MKTASNPPSLAVSARLDPETAAEVEHYIEHHLVNRSALLRRGIRLALDELKAKHSPQPKARKGS